ncbi:MAG: thioesterase family protein, partial [Acidimicrobiales bacterium]
ILGRSIEAVVEPGERIARVAIELVRPVPLVPLRVVAERVGVSRRVAHVEARIEVADGGERDGQVVATARGLLLATTAMPDPGYAADEAEALIGPEAAVPAPDWATGAETIGYHKDAVEHRPVSGGFGAPGPADQWIRLRGPLVEGEHTSPLCRLLAVADFGSGISSIFDFSAGVGLINADITVAVHREPIGDWIRLQSTTRIGPDGVGLCTTILSDEHGPVGTGLQSLLGVLGAD